MTKENERVPHAALVIVCNAGTHWSRGGMLASLVGVAAAGHRGWVLGLLAVATLTFSIGTMAASAQDVGWRRIVEVTALTTLCVLGVGGVALLCLARWWGVAGLLGIVVAPIVWATSSIVWKLESVRSCMPLAAAAQKIAAFMTGVNAQRLTLLRDVAAASDGLMTPTLARLLAGRGGKLDRDYYLTNAEAEAKDIADAANRQLTQALDELIAGKPDPEAPVEVELRPGVRKAVPWGTQLLSCELHAADVEDCLRRSGIAGSAWQIEKVDFVAWLVELRHGKELTTYKIPQGVRQNFAGAFLAFTDVVNPEAGAQIRVQLLRRALAAIRLIWTP